MKTFFVFSIKTLTNEIGLVKRNKKGLSSDGLSNTYFGHASSEEPLLYDKCKIVIALNPFPPSSYLSQTTNKTLKKIGQEIGL